MPVICDDLLLKRSPCKHGLWIYNMEKGLFLHGTFKIHFTQVQLRGTMKTPGFFANTAISNIYLIEGSTSMNNLRTSLDIIKQPIQNHRDNLSESRIGLSSSWFSVFIGFLGPKYILSLYSLHSLVVKYMWFLSQRKIYLWIMANNVSPQENRCGVKEHYWVKWKTVKGSLGTHCTVTALTPGVFPCSGVWKNRWEEQLFICTLSSC